MESSMDVHGERRRKPRMNESIPVSVRGSNSGNSYKFKSFARDIGPSGLCAFAPRMMQKGERVLLQIRFARLGSKTPQAPEISMRGLVVRVEERPGGFCFFAVSFLLHQLL